MKKLPNWNISQESARRLSGLLDKAATAGIDADAVTAAGLPAWRALTALQQAADSKEGAGRDRLLARAQDALQALEPRDNPTLLQQLQARLLALRGRNGDQEIAHVTDGEVVIPKSLQTSDVVRALEAAAERAQIPMERFRVGAAANAVNPETGISEFADPVANPMEEITINANRAKFAPQTGDEEMLTRLMFSEGADHYAKHPEIFPAIGWSAFNRIGEPNFQGGTNSLQTVIQAEGQFNAVGEKRPDGGPSLWDLSAEPGKLTGPNKTAYEAAQASATRLLSGNLEDPTGGAQYFHSAPQTSPGFQRMLDGGRIEPVGTPIGKFKFFRNTP
jgi:hypothetical protein